MLLRSLSVAALAALCCSKAAESDLQPAPSPLPQVTVEAGQAALERRVDAFVRVITRHPGFSDEESLVRWNTPICLLVAGSTAEDITLMSTRLSQIGSLVGAPLARTPCRPNFVIISTSEPDRVLNSWYARDNRLFGDATAANIHQFLDSSESRPVRVWYNIDSGRKAGTRNGHFIPSDTRAESSAFAGNAALSFSSIFAIIDTRRTEHIRLDQLADYMAMVGLTSVDLDAGLGSAPSILRLFSPSEESQSLGLSGWDTAFLEALYQSNQTSRAQRLEVTERVVHDISR